MGGRVPIEPYRSLYHQASADVVLRYVHEIDASVESALVVGHNPGIFDLAWLLLADRDDEGPGTDRPFLEAQGFPTCALAVLTMKARVSGPTSAPKAADWWASSGRPIERLPPEPRPSLRGAGGLVGLVQCVPDRSERGGESPAR